MTLVRFALVLGLALLTVAPAPPPDPVPVDRPIVVQRRTTSVLPPEIVNLNTFTLAINPVNPCVAYPQRIAMPQPYQLEPCPPGPPNYAHVVLRGWGPGYVYSEPNSSNRLQLAMLALCAAGQSPPCPTDKSVTGSIIAQHYKTYYRVSTDNGVTATTPDLRPVRASGARYTAHHPFDGIVTGRNSYSITGRGIINRASNGDILVPLIVWPLAADGYIYEPSLEHPSLDVTSFGTAHLLVGRWTKGPKGTDVEWTLRGAIPIGHEGSTRGANDTTIAELNPAVHGAGKYLAVVRQSNEHDNAARRRQDCPDWLQGSDLHINGRHFYAMSSDYGKTWTQARPWGFADGTLFSAPSALSALVRSPRNNKLYWIGNIADHNPCGNSPRTKLVIGEVDEVNLGVIRDTLTVVDQYTSQALEGQLSNFQVYTTPAKQIVIALTSPRRNEPRQIPDWYVVDVGATGDTSPTLSATISGTKVTLNWDGSGPSQLYRRQLAPLSAGQNPEWGVVAALTTETSFANSGFGDGSLYEFVLVKGATRQVSNVVRVAFGLSHSIEEDAVTLDWSGGPQYSQYRLERRIMSPPGRFEPVTVVHAPQTSFVDSGLGEGVEYEYRLTPLDQAARPVTTAQQTTAVTFPSTFIEAYAERGTAFVHIADPRRSQRSSYRIYRRPSESPTWSYIGSIAAGKSLWVNAGAREGQSNTFRIDPVGGVGPRSSNEATVTFRHAGLQHFKRMPPDGSTWIVTLEWETIPGVTATSYQVYRSKNCTGTGPAELVATLKPSSRSFSNGGFRRGSGSYLYEVRMLVGSTVYPTQWGTECVTIPS